MIFKGKASQFGSLYQDQKTAIRLNTLFKKLGIESVENGSNTNYTDLDLLRSKLTLILHPNRVADYRKTFSITFENAISLFFKHLKTQTYWPLNLRDANAIDENQVNFTAPVSYDDKIYEVPIGFYLPSRNIIVICYPIHHPSECSKEFYDWFIDYFEKAARDANCKTINVSKFKKEFIIRHFTKNLAKRVSVLKEAIEAENNNTKSYQQNLNASFNNLLNYKIEIEALKKFIKNGKEELEKELQEIEKLPFITKVTLSESGIILLTKVAHVNFKGKKESLGTYKIILKPERFSLVSNNPVEGPDGDKFHHPHIAGSSMCLGNRTNKAHELLANLKLKELTFFLWLFLNSYNPNDAMIRMSKFLRYKQKDFSESEESD